MKIEESGKSADREKGESDRETNHRRATSCDHRIQNKHLVYRWFGRELQTVNLDKLEDAPEAKDRPYLVIVFHWLKTYLLAKESDMQT